MEFGSEQTRDLIFHYLDDGDEMAYNELYAIIRRDALALMRDLRIQASDKEDIVDGIEIHVLQHLVPFAMEARYNTVGERNAWLKRTVDWKKKDYLREQARRRKWIDPKDLGDYSTITDDVTSGAEKRLESMEEMLRAIEKLFTIRTTPENIMCYILSKLNSKKKNGSVKEICDYVNGKTLREVFSITKQVLQHSLGYSIPETVFIQLERRVNENPESIVDISVRPFTDASSRIAKKMRDYAD